MFGRLDVPLAVCQKAAAAGDAGRQWLDQLDASVSALAAEWSLDIGDVLTGGSEALVTEVTTAAGEAAILKLCLPTISVRHEAAVLRCAGGEGYARLLRADEARGAILLERLGPRMAELGLPVSRQIELICATLRRCWTVHCDVTAMTGAEKAAWLESFITESWEVLGRPCDERVVARAAAYCDTRRAAFDPAHAVLVHGDAHAHNALREPHHLGAFKLVDPDGLLAEPACDLAVPMREWSRELRDAPDPMAAAQARCATLSRLTGVPRQPIWEWGFMERVSTGLLLLSLDREQEGRLMLEVAEAIAAIDAD